MKLRIGVLGAGHLGKIHMKCIRELPDQYELVGFFDPSIKSAKEAAAQFELMPFHSMQSLIDSVDVVDIVTPTISHFECANLYWESRAIFTDVLFVIGSKMASFVELLNLRQFLSLVFTRGNIPKTEI